MRSTTIEKNEKECWVQEEWGRWSNEKWVTEEKAESTWSSKDKAFEHAAGFLKFFGVKKFFHLFLQFN